MKLNIRRLPIDLKWLHIDGAGFLAYIDFTIPIFITNLAFKNGADLIDSPKLAILVTLLLSGIVAFIYGGDVICSWRDARGN